MDDKLRSVLSNPELMEKIASLVKGDPLPEPPPAQPAASYGQMLPANADKGLALLSALAPFLKESRRKKLETARSAITVASVYRNMKNI